MSVFVCESAIMCRLAYFNGTSKVFDPKSEVFEPISSTSAAQQRLVTKKREKRWDGVKEKEKLEKTE